MGSTHYVVFIKTGHSPIFVFLNLPLPGPSRGGVIAWFMNEEQNVFADSPGE